VNGEVISRSKS